MSWCCFRRVSSDHDLTVVRPIESEITIKNHLQGRGDSAVIFEEILRNSEQKEQLFALCKKDYCDESLYFISAFLEWKKNQTEQGAVDLLNNYINPDAKYPINIAGGYFERISDLLKDYNKNKEQVLQELQKCFDVVAADLRGNFV